MIAAYLLKTILCSAVFYLYYSFVLRDKAFHRYNRYYLLFTPILSLLLPLLKLPVNIHPADVSGQVIQTLGVINMESWEEELTLVGRQSSLHNIIYSPYAWTILYLIGCLVVLIPFVRSVLAIDAIRKRYVAESWENIRFYNTNEPGTPFSFFRTVFWNRNISLLGFEGQHIMRHEMFHVEQRHSADLVYIEIIKSLFWFNPFFYLMRRELKTIHEFLADEHATSHTNCYDYAELLLLQAISLNRSDPFHHFFNTEIKRRIAMITRSKNKYSYVGRAMALPLVLVIFCAFSLRLSSPAREKLGQQISSDTMPLSELLKLNFSEVQAFSVNVETARLSMNGKEPFIVKRKVLNEYLEMKEKEQGAKPKAPVRKQDPDKTFTRTEIEACYPGGVTQWGKFLNKTFKYPKEALDKGISGRILLQFIVNTNGDVSDVQVLSGPTEGGLREEAVRIINASGRWEPAVQNGRKVKAYKKQPINFLLDAD